MEEKLDKKFCKEQLDKAKQEIDSEVQQGNKLIAQNRRLLTRKATYVTNNNESEVNPSSYF